MKFKVSDTTCLDHYVENVTDQEMQEAIASITGGASESTEKRKRQVLAMFLHNEFCDHSECDGSNDYMDAAKRLLPKIERHL